MKPLILMVALCLTVAAMPLPSFTGGPSSVTVTQIGQTILSGTLTTTLKTNRDSIYWQTNVAAGGVLPIYSISPTPFSWENLIPLNAAFDGSTLTFLQNGTCFILLRYGTPETSTTYPVTFTVFSSTGAGTNYTFSTNVVGSLSHHISTNTFSRMTGDAVARRALFTTRTVATTNYTRNTDYFLANVNGIEAYPAGNSGPYDYMNGCLISPRHLLSVYHIGSQMGQTVWFVNRTNNTVTARNVIDYMRVNLYNDQTVALLSEPLPASIVPAAIITNSFVFFPQLTNTGNEASFIRRVPTIVFNQTQLPGIRYLSHLAENFNTETLSSYGSWARDQVGGDSGSPCGVVISNRLCIIGNFTSAAGGTSTSVLNSEVQAAMDLLCSRNGFTNESLQTIPLGGFTTY